MKTSAFPAFGQLLGGRGSVALGGALDGADAAVQLGEALGGDIGQVLLVEVNVNSAILKAK